MILTAYGLVIFFASNQAIILTYGIYPPFGLITISFLGAGAYLLFVGIYSSSISVAQDISLNKMLKQQVTKFGLIENIGSGERARIETKIATMQLILGRKWKTCLVYLLLGKNRIYMIISNSIIRKFEKNLLETLKCLSYDY